MPVGYYVDAVIIIVVIFGIHARTGVVDAVPIFDIVKCDILGAEDRSYQCFFLLFSEHPDKYIIYYLSITYYSYIIDLLAYYVSHY